MAGKIQIKYTQKNVSFDRLSDLSSSSGCSDVSGRLDNFVVNSNKEYNRYPSVSEIFLNMNHVSKSTLNPWKTKKFPESKKTPEILELAANGFGISD